MARVAVFHNTLDFHGGADAVCLHTRAALAADHDVTLCTASRTDPSTLADQFGLPFEVRVVQPPGAGVLATGFEAAGPFVGPQLAARTALLQTILGRRLGSFDGVVSTANELSLPVPSVQYVHFPQLHLHRTETADGGLPNRRWSRLAGPVEVTADRPRPVANSAWTADVAEECYGVRPAVCHPPVDPIDGRPWADRESGILVLGRLAPDKRTLDAVTALDRLRARGDDLTGHVVGTTPPAYRGYVDRIERAAAERPYLTVETDVPRERLTDLLGRYRYGLNAKSQEHFWMAVAEYVAAGMRPFAPAERPGGCPRRRRPTVVRRSDRSSRPSRTRRRYGSAAVPARRSLRERVVRRDDARTRRRHPGIETAGVRPLDMATQNTAGGFALATDSMTPLHWAGVVLAVVTGVLHLGLGASFGLSGLGISFIFAGVAFIAGAGAVLVDYRRRLFYLLGIPFTLGQLVAWYVVNAPSFSPLGLLDKVVQVAFVVVLVLLLRGG
jgi:hypothetical protein